MPRLKFTDNRKFLYHSMINIFLKLLEILQCSMCSRCFAHSQLLPRLLHASVTYLKPHDLDLPIGLISRLVLADDVFVEQFAHCVDNLKVRHISCILLTHYLLSISQLVILGNCDSMSIFFPIFLILFRFCISHCYRHFFSKIKVQVYWFYLNVSFLMYTPVNGAAVPVSRFARVCGLRV